MCPIFAGNLKKIGKFVTKRFICYSWHELGGFTVTYTNLFVD